MADQSIWKKEIHLRKRTGEPVQATPPPRFEEKKDSIWHRELTFRKSEKTMDEPVAEVAPAHEAAIEPVEPPVQAASPIADPPVVGPPSRFELAPEPAAPTYQPPVSQPAAETYSSPAYASVAGAEPIVPQVPVRAEEPRVESAFGAPAPMWEGHAAELPMHPPVAEPSVEVPPRRLAAMGCAE